jgi:hypothetical protein
VTRGEPATSEPIHRLESGNPSPLMVTEDVAGGKRVLLPKLGIGLDLGRLIG